jgi:hypothetical protein
MSSDLEIFNVWLYQFARSQLSATGLTAVFLGVVIIAGAMWILSPRQRLITGIPIVGGEDNESIQRSRIRFVHDGMSMLLDGYRKVCCSLSPFKTRNHITKSPSRQMEDYTISLQSSVNG